VPNLVLIPCPLCGNAARFLPLRITRADVHIGKYGDLYRGHARSSWQACGECGFVHQNPRPSLQSLTEFYAQGRYHDPELPASVERYLEFARWYYEEKVAHAIAASGLAGASVLEVGCGLGGALTLFRERGWTAHGVEPDAERARFAAQALGLQEVRPGLLDASFRLERRVEVAFSNHTFEHIADLDSAMRALVRVLAPGGYVFTAVPTYYSNRSRLSKLWMNSGHYSLFTHRTLNQLFARHGLEEVSHTYRGWRKEIDELWHVARYTGAGGDPRSHYEDPRAVQKYVNIYNPLRSALFAPLYMGHANRVALAAIVRRAAMRWLGRAAAPRKQAGA
jgi:SAM-dependent methyltransferase